MKVYSLILAALMACAALASEPVAPSTPSPKAKGNASQPKEEGDLSGIYYLRGSLKVKGEDKEYVGITTITKNGSSYLVVNAVGADTSLGMGIRNGKNFAVVWQVANDPKQVGVTLYRIDGKSMDGEWVMLGSAGSVHPETLQWLRKAEPDSGP